MPVYPNTDLTQSLAPWYGSCKIEVSTDNGSNYTNVGLARNVVFNEVIESADIQADNGPDVKTYVSAHTVNITFNGLEFYIPTLDKIRGGIDTIGVTTGGVKTTDTDVYTTGTPVRNKIYYFDNQGDSTTLPAVISVKSVDTANATDTLASTKDYTTFKDADNHCGIIILSTAVGGGNTGITTQNLRIRYEYETVAARTMKSGGLTTISSRWFRLTNKQIVSGTAKYRYLTVYSGTLNAGMNLAFKSANETDPLLENPVSIIAKLDTTRSEGDQLFLIEDEVATA
jgi:hypothetical protein